MTFSLVTDVMLYCAWSSFFWNWDRHMIIYCYYLFRKCTILPRHTAPACYLPTLQSSSLSAPVALVTSPGGHGPHRVSLLGL